MPSLIGTTVAANYLVATAPFSQFGTRQVQIINVALSGIDTTPTIANSNLSKAIRGIQAMAEIYAVGTPTSGNCQFIIAVDTVTNADSTSGGVDSGTGYGKLEAAIKASTGGTATVTAVAL